LVPPFAQATPTRRFRFLRCLGWGGFGEVYLAELATSSGFEKKVAVKVLRADVADRDSVARRLRDEGRLLGLLQHPAIVRADDLVQLAGQPAVVMEYVPGANLSTLIDRRFCPTLLPTSVALYVVRRVASALEAAFHSPSPSTGEPLRVLHRDIKPSNIRVTPHGEVKVLDFGIARSSHHAREAVTKDYQLGSMPYMAPEAMGGKKATAASDVYSLGAVLFELLSRSRLGWAGEVQAAHEAQIAAALERLELDSCAETERAELRALLEQMLVFDPDARPDAAEVEQRCRALERRVSGPSLEEWVRVALPALRVPELLTDAPLVGKELTEDLSSTTEADLPTDSTIRRPLAPGDSGDDRTVETGSAPGPDATPVRRRGLLGAGLALVLLAGIAGTALLMQRGLMPAAEPTPPAVEPEAPPAEDARASSPELPGPDAHGSGDPPQPAPAAEDFAQPEAPAPRPAPIHVPASASTVEPVVVETDPEVEALQTAPGPALEPVEVRVGSLPFGLAVFLDDQPLGETPQVLQVAPGPHMLRFEDGEHRFEASIQVASDQENRWTYDRAKDDLR
jgi:eukaryotic-like serine/threonine-protein kinase